MAAAAYPEPKRCGGVPQSSGEPGKWSRWNAESSGKCQRLAVRAGAGADLGAIVGIPAAGATLPARPLPALRAETTRLGPTVGASSAGSGCRWLGASRRRIRPARRRLDLAPDVSCGPAYEGNCLLDVFTPGADDCTWGAYVFPRPAYERDCLPTTRLAGLRVFPAGLRLPLPRLRRRRRFPQKGEVFGFVGGPFWHFGGCRTGVFCPSRPCLAAGGSPTFNLKGAWPVGWQTG